MFSCWHCKWLQWAEFCLPFSQWEHCFRSLSSTALFIFMNLCHYAFTKLLGEEGNLADGCSVLSHRPRFFRKLSYLPNTNSFGYSHSHGECGPSPTRCEHQVVFLRWPTVLLHYPYYRRFVLPLLFSQDNFHTSWRMLILPAVKLFHQKKSKKKEKLDSERCKRQWKKTDTKLGVFSKYICLN